MKGASAVIVALIVVVAVLAVINLIAGALDPITQAEREQQAQIDAQHRAALAPLVLWFKRIGILAGIIACLSGATIAASAALSALGISISVPRKARFWSHLVRQDKGQLPAYMTENRGPDRTPQIELHAPHRNPQAEIAGALVGGNVNRLPASTPKALGIPATADDVAAPGPDARITVDQALDVDPISRPHVLLIGETGAGKSSASYLLLDRVRQRHRAEVIICERDGINWNDQVATITPAGYVDALSAVETERLRRAELLRAADVDHISRLPVRLPYIVVVIEEAESIYGDLALQDKRLSQTYTMLLRNLASMGRKEGIMLVAITQTGTSQVFDVPTRKQFGTKLIFRSEPAVGDSWGIPREIGLSRLPTGTAYSLSHAALVTFPQVTRPRLPISTLYREPRLALSADAESDGLGAADEPSTAAAVQDGVQEAVLVGVQGETAVFGVQAPPVAVRVPLRDRLARLPKDAPITTIEDSEALYSLWVAVNANLSEVERQVYGYDGGMAHYWAAPAINAALARRSLPARYKEQGR